MQSPKALHTCCNVFLRRLLAVMMHLFDPFPRNTLQKSVTAHIILVIIA